MREYILDHTKPIHRYFEEISQIPRETEHEEEISDYLMKFAEDRGLEHWRDDLWNVVIKKPASEGYENAKPVILQAHTDMVCSKTTESSHDFRKDPIEFVLEGNILRAKDTSLGADDGFGVAYILAILDDRTMKHPPLECVFTTQEEHKSMVGAEKMDVSGLSGKRMINLDGDGETATFVSSACSDQITISHSIESRVPVQDKVFEMTVKNMTGSVIKGVADNDCANAVKVIFRIFASLQDEGYHIRLCEVNGGTGENRSPAEAKSVFSCNEEDSLVLAAKIQTIFDAFISQYEGTEYAGELRIGPAAEEKSMYSAIPLELSRKIITMFYLLPNNMVQADLKSGDAESISTFGLFRTTEYAAEAVLSVRSMHKEAEDTFIRHVRMLSGVLGFDIRVIPRYRSWAYNKNSEIRRLFNEVYMEKQNTTLEEIICPGGLEVSWFVSKIPELDAITIGPVHDNVHTYNEYMDLDSFDRVYDIVVTVLERMKE